MVWRFLDIRNFSESEYSTAFLMMDGAKKARVEKIRQKKDKMRTVLGDYLARALISEVLGKEPYTLRFTYGEYGKPSLMDEVLYFNVSHCEDIVVAAVSEKPIGIDVERIREISPFIAKKYFCPREQHYLFGHDARDTDFEHPLTPDARMRFFELWTAKEAYLKCRGTGMTHVKNVDTTLRFFRRHLLPSDYLVSIYEEKE